MANVGHIGSALSIADILAVLYEKILHIPSVNHPDRDRFILSKGHAALALYACLFLKKYIPVGILNAYCQDSSLLGVHPEHQVSGIDFSTGSLGQGVTYAVGAALAAKLQKSKRKVFALISDAECNEGSVWEAAMFASQHQLSNLTVIIDLNGQQALDYTKKVLDLCPMIGRWRAFGWNAVEIDGHDEVKIEQSIRSFDISSGLPHVLIAHTTFGKGVSYMENQIKWHYWPMSDKEYEQALKEIESVS